MQCRDSKAAAHIRLCLEDASACKPAPLAIMYVVRAIQHFVWQSGWLGFERCWPETRLETQHTELLVLCFGQLGERVSLGVPGLAWSRDSFMHIPPLQLGTFASREMGLRLFFANLSCRYSGLRSPKPIIGLSGLKFNYDITP